MSESRALQEPPDVPRSVTIVDANAFQMPYKCVMCGQGVSGLFSYVQDHIPIVWPGFGWVRITPVAIPYCEQHREVFEQRFRRLRTAQGVAYVIIFLCAFTIFFAPVRLAFGWTPEPGVVAGVFGGVLFLFLVTTVFCIKPFLYDAFFKYYGNRIIIKSRSSLFIKNVIEQNSRIVE